MEHQNVTILGSHCLGATRLPLGACEAWVFADPHSGLAFRQSGSTHSRGAGGERTGEKQKLRKQKTETGGSGQILK